MSDPFKNPDQFGAQLGGVKYTPAAQGRPQAIDRPSNWREMSAVDQRVWTHQQQRLQQAADSKAAAARLPPKPSNWEKYSATEKRCWMLQAQAGAR
jgi:hypothetical protein